MSHISGGVFIAKAHLAKAYVIRLEVVMMLVVANSKHTRGKLKFQVRPGVDQCVLMNTE
jgi:hypothetical protein